MKVLIIGQGGREHALVKAFGKSPLIQEIHVVPGNDGIAHESLCHPNINWKETEQLIKFCKQTDISFVFIGPEDPLVAGIADQLRNAGIPVIGPNQEAAMLEGSKIFAKEFMNEAKASTSPFKVVSSVQETMDAADFFIPPFVLKADGLAAGKGVFICEDKKDLQEKAQFIFEQKGLGHAGERALLEQYLPGWEVSVLVLTNGHDYKVLPMAQDHKRLLDQDKGPNTGGMGVVAPLNIDEDLFKKIEQDLIKPVIKLIQDKEFMFRGILYFGIMVTQKGPQILEFNCRFGDPEAQAILPLIDNDCGQLFKELSEGRLHNLKVKNLFSSVVIQAAEGYPDLPIKGTPIEGDLTYETPSSYFIHAGTKKSEQNWHTNGGRVLAAVGLGSSLQESLDKAYQQANRVTWKGLQMRKDIGQKRL
jgi:phosphoribosylamine--glycine ligase